MYILQITGTVVGYGGGGSGGSHSPHAPSSGIAHRGDPRAGHQVNIGKLFGGADGGLGNTQGGSNGTANTGGGGGGSRRTKSHMWWRWFRSLYS